MDVNSVSKSVVQPPAAAKKPAPEQQAQANVNAQKPNPPEAEPKPKPVVNSQGQITGRHLNVTA